MLAELDSDEWTEWIAWHQLDPFGERREDIRFGNIMAMLALLARVPHPKPADFQLFRPPTAPLAIVSDEVAAARMRSLFGAMQRGKRS